MAQGRTPTLTLSTRLKAETKISLKYSYLSS